MHSELCGGWSRRLTGVVMPIELTQMITKAPRGPAGTAEITFVRFLVFLFAPLEELPDGMFYFVFAEGFDRRHNQSVQRMSAARVRGSWMLGSGAHR
jgi:hypothetical protein